MILVSSFAVVAIDSDQPFVTRRMLESRKYVTKFTTDFSWYYVTVVKDNLYLEARHSN